MNGPNHSLCHRGRGKRLDDATRAELDHQLVSNPRRPDTAVAAEACVTDKTVRARRIYLEESGQIERWSGLAWRPRPRADSTEDETGDDDDDDGFPESLVARYYSHGANSALVVLKVTTTVHLKSGKPGLVGESGRLAIPHAIRNHILDTLRGAGAQLGADPVADSGDG